MTQKLEHRPTLDGLRGFACILVVISHLLPSNTIGALGVIMFFSLSGFLMGMLYLDKPCIKTNIVKYSISRISRIAPAYYVAITLYVVVFTLLPDGNELTAVGIARTYLFMGSISVFWSIPPEIQFYVFFIGLWYAYQSFTQKSYIPIILVGIISTIFLLTRELWPGIMLPSKLHVFLLGVGASYLVKFKYVTNLLQKFFVQILLVTLSVGYYLIFTDSSNIYTDLILAILVALMVTSLSFGSWVTKVFELRVIRFIGGASFSIYLFHVPIIHMFDVCIMSVRDNGSLYFLLVLCLSIAIPSLFYLFLEKRLNISFKSLLTKIYETIARRGVVDQVSR